jgi:hypothetical protein
MNGALGSLKPSDPEECVSAALERLQRNFRGETQKRMGPERFRFARDLGARLAREFEARPEVTKNARPKPTAPATTPSSAPTSGDAPGRPAWRTPVKAYANPPEASNDRRASTTKDDKPRASLITREAVEAKQERKAAEASHGEHGHHCKSNCDHSHPAEERTLFARIEHPCDQPAEKSLKFASALRPARNAFGRIEKKSRNLFCGHAGRECQMFAFMARVQH